MTVGRVWLFRRKRRSTGTTTSSGITPGSDIGTTSSTSTKRVRFSMLFILFIMFRSLVKIRPVVLVNLNRSYLDESIAIAVLEYSPS